MSLLYNHNILSVHRRKNSSHSRTTTYIQPLTVRNALPLCQGGDLKEYGVTHGIIVICHNLLSCGIYTALQLTLGARVRSEGYGSWVCLSVCPCCLLSHISPLEHLFVLKILSRTPQATEVEIFVGISLKPLRCRDTLLPAL